MSDCIIPAPYQVKDVSGQRFGRLLVLGYVGRTHAGGKPRATFLCQCDCGSQIRVIGTSLSSGNTTSCGCLALQKKAARATRHGMAYTAEYRVWYHIKDRCFNSRCHGYRHYGERGIAMCERWAGEDGFANFLADMGQRPSPLHSIERVDVDGDYSPANCIWATSDVQARNRRNTRKITFRGETLCITDWAARLGFHPGTLLNRIMSGMTVEEALTTPKGQRRTRHPCS